eukprot:12922799-Alexandrium_andersonii.AAC.1
MSSSSFSLHSADQPLSQSVSHSVSHSLSPSFSQSFSQPVSHSASQSFSQSVSQSLNQSASQPVSQSANQPATCTSPCVWGGLAEVMRRESVGQRQWCRSEVAVARVSVGNGCGVGVDGGQLQWRWCPR